MAFLLGAACEKGKKKKLGQKIRLGLNLGTLNAKYQPKEKYSDINNLKKIVPT